MAASEGPGEDTSKWNMWSFRLFDVFLCDPACLSVNESKWGVSRKGLQVYILHMWLPGGVSCWMPHSKIVGFLTWRKASAGSRAKIVKWILSSEGFQLQVSHWRCPCICWQVKLRKCMWSSGCVQFEVGTGVMHALFREWSCTSEGCQADVFSSRFHIWGVKVIKWISSVPVLAVEVCKYLLASRDVQVTVFKWIYSAQCLAVEAWKYRLASEVVQVKVVNSCAEALRQKCTTRQRHERHVKETNANIEFKCYLVPVCVRLEVTTLFIGQKKSVINRLNSVNIAALLCPVTYRYAVFGREPFCLLHFGRGTNMDCTRLHFSFQNYLRQLFKPHRWKCDPLEANKETQQGITGNNMWDFWQIS